MGKEADETFDAIRRGENTDNVKFLVDMVQVVVPPPKTFEAPTKKVRTKKS